MVLLPRTWLRISIFNLLVVSIIGVILRYKIAFYLPLVDQKHLLHGHSHFAFAGWVGQALMTLLVASLNRKAVFLKKYQYLLYINLITAYGMLIGFTTSGYNIVSIGFSTVSIINSYVFGILFWRDLNKSKQYLTSHLWYKAAILFNIISSLGAFALSYLMAHNSTNQNYYLLAVYVFLHFQYNGWFFFVCFGVFISQIEKITSVQGKLKTIFWLFSLACIPSYFLSALWLSIPIGGYIIIAIAAIAQCVGWVMLLKIIAKNWGQFKQLFTKHGRWLLLMSSIALSIKLLLQLLSTIPALSQFAFGFRPIVIGYLHLMLLGVISIFILGYGMSSGIIKSNKYAKTGIILFVIGVIINQLMLMTQGIASMNYVGIPYISELLFIAAIIMFLGLLLLNIGTHTIHFRQRELILE